MVANGENILCSICCTCGRANASVELSVVEIERERTRYSVARVPGRPLPIASEMFWMLDCFAVQAGILVNNCLLLPNAPLQPIHHCSSNFQTRGQSTQSENRVPVRNREPSDSPPNFRICPVHACIAQDCQPDLDIMMLQ